MITLFKPWREGTDLKGKLDSWDNIFNVTKFTKRMMQNLNLRYERSDERDDYYNQNKTGPVPMFSRCDRDSQPSVDQDQDLFAYGTDEDITRPDVSMQGNNI
jgi:predicted Zn-dependent protease